MKIFIGFIAGIVVGIGGTVCVLSLTNYINESVRTRAIAQAQASVDAQTRADAGQRAEGRQSATVSTLESIRDQIELFQAQHKGIPPDQSALDIVLTGKTNSNDTSVINSSGLLGPYLQTFPTNPVNGKHKVDIMPSTKVGWVYKVEGHNYTLEAVNTAGDGVLPW